MASVFLMFHGTLVPQQTLSFLESCKISQLRGHQDLIGTSTPIPNSSRTNFPSKNIQLFPTTHSNMREQNHDQRVHPGGLGKRDSSQGRGLWTWLGPRRHHPLESNCVSIQNNLIASPKQFPVWKRLLISLKLK